MLPLARFGLFGVSALGSCSSVVALSSVFLFYMRVPRVMAVQIISAPGSSGVGQWNSTGQACGGVRVEVPPTCLPSPSLWNPGDEGQLSLNI